MASARGMSARPAWTAENPSSSCMKSGSRKVIDIRTENMIDPMIVPERNTLSLNSDRSTAGTGAVSSRMTKAVSRKKARKVQIATGIEENQSLRLPSSRTYCSAASPNVMRRTPCQSRFLRCSAARSRLERRMSSGSCTKRVTMKMPSRPTGMLM